MSTYARGHKPRRNGSSYRCAECGQPVVQVTRYVERVEGAKTHFEPRTWVQHAPGLSK